MDATKLETYCDTWGLKKPILLASTFTSDVFKVEYDNTQAVLKILNEKGMNFEIKGALVLTCFNGHGAVQLLRSDEGAHLLEFADGPQLKSLVLNGEDQKATDIIASTIAALHSYSGQTPEGLINMERNFRSLFQLVSRSAPDSLYAVGAKIAERLISTEQEVRVLHGDIHHENVLLSSKRGWLAIDPQCVVGERTYDTANTFYNPNGYLVIAQSEDTIKMRSQTFSQKLKLDQKRVLEYAFAYGCLSAAWSIEDGFDEKATLQIVKSIYNVLQNFK